MIANDECQQCQHFINGKNNIILLFWLLYLNVDLLYRQNIHNQLEIYRHDSLSPIPKFPIISVWKIFDVKFVCLFVSFVHQKPTHILSWRHQIVGRITFFFNIQTHVFCFVCALRCCLLVKYGWEYARNWLWSISNEQLQINSVNMVAHDGEHATSNYYNIHGNCVNVWTQILHTIELMLIFRTWLCCIFSLYLTFATCMQKQLSLDLRCFFSRCFFACLFCINFHAV